MKMNIFAKMTGRYLKRYWILPRPTTLPCKERELYNTFIHTIQSATKNKKWEEKYARTT